MADISALGQLSPVEPLDLENYADSKAFVPLPAAGEYMLQTVSTFPSSAFGVTRKGALSVQIDPTIVDGPAAGYQLRYTRISAQPFKRNSVTVSQAGDYLRANGFRGQLTSAQDLADAIERTAGRTFRAELDWSAYSKADNFRLNGMENFPSDGQGGYLPWCEHPTMKDDTGAPLRLRANLVIERFIPAE